MDLIDRIKDLANRAAQQIDHIETEEATKNAFIMPFISSLGYDVFNPMEVIPEFTADIGTKKGEKVDYAIKKDNNVIILIECKWCGADLHKEHASQLYRYFSATEARFAILTNGIEYEFYSDIDEPNKMDSKPFFSFNLSQFEEHQVGELKKFTKSSFCLEDIITSASTLKYTGAIKKILEDEMKTPSEAFVRFFASQIYDGRITQPVLEQFTGIVKEARIQFINEKINERLKSAMSTDQDSPVGSGQTIDNETKDNKDTSNGAVTTQDEIDGFNVVKAIARDVTDAARIFMRDTKSYCGVILDDNNRKPICRMHFNSSQKYIGLFKNKKEERIPIETVDDIFNLSERIKETIQSYETAVVAEETS
jgi:hypothetical protein